MSGTAVSPDHDALPVTLPRALFTAEEVARCLAISPTLVRQLTSTGDLRCRRIGRLVRYTHADITAFAGSDRGESG